jgi:hypothetical protein
MEINRKYIWTYFKLGFLQANEMKLSKKENWTPLLIYIHISRIILGFILGIIFEVIINIIF